MPPQPSSLKTGLPSQTTAAQPARAARSHLASARAVGASARTGRQGFENRRLLQALLAARNGDFSARLPSDLTGVEGKIADAFNDIMVANETLARELDRVSRVVGKEGKIGQRASFTSSGGAWRRMEDSVNTLVSDLVRPISEITRAIGAVAKGDLTSVMNLEVDGRPLQGEFLRGARICNTMIGKLGVFTSEVTRVAREVGTEGKLGGQAKVKNVSGAWKELTENFNSMAGNLTAQVRNIAEVATAIGKGDLTRSIQVDARGEVARLKDHVNAMISKLRDTTQRNTEQDWLKTNIARFTGMLQGQHDLLTVGRMLLSELAPLVNSQRGVIYLIDTTDAGPYLKLLASYAYRLRSQDGEKLDLGEGLPGQCAIEQRPILLSGVSDHGFEISSGLVSTTPANIIVLPVIFEGQTKAVIELASLREFSPTHLAFLEQLTGSLGIVLNTIEATMRTEGLLKQSQELAGELGARQIEFQRANKELAEKARQLAEQNAEVERKNRQIEQARRAVEEKVAELTLTSKYKSEFLANMSHELRTPLNSILILAQQLADNPQGGLAPQQVEFAQTIRSAGTDLLNLISDILDLSKIESGTVAIEAEEVPYASVRETLERNFRHVAETRNLGFNIQVDTQLPRSNIATDGKRLLQVLKNLLSNAFKFTVQGQVDLSISLAASGWSTEHPVLSRAPQVVAFEVRDTGIGIPPDKQRIVFEAFQQADSGTSRRFGGTGLGLAISRELANLLGGEIRLLSSAPGRGSTFTLYLPQIYAGGAVDKEAPAQTLPAVRALAVPEAEVVPDDRDTIQPGDPLLLIAEDDPNDARVLLRLAHDKGFKCLVASRGSVALSLAREFKPTAISLDILLPDMLGWTVLGQLKQDPATRHIPVQIIIPEEEHQIGLERGAFSCLTKPVATAALEAALARLREYTRPRVKQLMIVDDDETERSSMVELLAYKDVEITTASSGREAGQLLRDRAFDCMVLDLSLPDISGLELLGKIQTEPGLRAMPIVVFTGKDLSVEEELQLRRMATSIIIGGVQSPGRLLDDTALFLHRVVTDLPEEKQRMLERLRQTDGALAGRKVLVVDDDVRNIFALTGLLERHKMDVVSASNGREAISLLERTADIALVLMDIMMPEMDGYQTLQAIRENPNHKLLPMIALTGKAMKGDREKCLEAGASDYIAKPVNTEQLLLLMRVWLQR